MKSLHVQQFLRNGGTLTALTEKYAINVKRHPLFPWVVLLKYNQIESPFSEPVVQDCRGIILDESDNWRVVCWSFRKFFNHGDPLAADIDWSTARVEEKADGSLMQLYHYADEWHVASSGLPDAGGNVISAQMEMKKTFADLFWETWYNLGYSITVLDTSFTYAFELMTPFNRVVVPHRESKLVLLGIRNRNTGEEFDPGGVVNPGFPTVRTYPLQSWDDCVEAARHVDPSEQEGYVVVDAQWNRVKMKAPAYVALAHMRDSAASPKKVLEVIRMGESTEFLAYFPEWKPTFDSIKERYDSLVAQAESSYERLKHIPIQKDFALEAQKSRYPAVLFQLRNGRASSARDFFSKVHIKHLMEALSVEDVELEAA